MSSLPEKIGRVAKAITGGVAALSTALTAALLDGVVTLPEWFTIGGAMVVGALLVWAVPNAPASLPAEPPVLPGAEPPVLPDAGPGH